MSKTKKIVYEGPQRDGLLQVGMNRVPFERGEPLEVPVEVADAVVAQEGSGWEEAPPKSGPAKKAKKEDG